MRVPGIAIPATTTRVINGYPTPNYAALVLRAPLRRLLQPESPQKVYDTFGQMVMQPFSLHADWPAGATDDLPVQQGDVLTISTTSPIAAGNQYAVFGVQAHQGLFLKLYVQVVPE